MTESPDLFRVEFQGPDRTLGRSPSSVVTLPQTSSPTPQIGFPVRPKTSRGPTRLMLQPRATLSVTGKTPFNAQ